MKKIITLIILSVSISMGNSFAQKSAIGVRGGAANGLTFKTYKGSQSAFEFLLSTRWRGFNFTALAERYTSPFDEKQLRFYYGQVGILVDGTIITTHFMKKMEVILYWV